MNHRLSPEKRRHLVWETALDRLELDVMRAERLLDEDATVAPPASWDEPELDGPIPDDLVERALALLERQRRVQDTLQQRLDASRQQHAFADRVDRATGRASVRGVGPALYLDIQA
ncbi:hypothetical protein [Nocardioides pacificus]